MRQLFQFFLIFISLIILTTCVVIIIFFVFYYGFDIAEKMCDFKHGRRNNNI